MLLLGDKKEEREKNNVAISSFPGIIKVIRISSGARKNSILDV
jgi:hypothetical protein